ncbi:MAG: peptidoglycan endopeptidase [Mycobacterium sp.]|nr:peptidoglycan endopeptidase [Mycobacterium sp.]MBV9721884.1 peptidoglycan endopeptidase [Mycobacterium sp.]
MFVLATLMGLLQQMSGTPYIRGNLSPAGTDCSGLASLVSNMAADRPVFGERFNTGNEESALLARGFQYGTAPGAVVIGWNGGHTAVTLPDGTPVSSGEGGGVHIGGGGAYQPQFTHHMYLPVDPDASQDAPPPPSAAVLVDAPAPQPPAFGPDPAPMVPAPPALDAIPVDNQPSPPPDPELPADQPGAAA